MATLNDIAKKVSSLAQLNLTRGKTKAYKTGNLYRNIGSYNTPNRVLGKTKLGKKRLSATDTRYGIELNLVYNPPGATYGQFVEEGTKYMDARPFAEEAINSPIIDRMIEEYVGIYVDETIIPSIEESLNMFDDIE
tara:strand:- start:1815 stop:2222 length:408 start_codon:yes stop_codon:yes gene_type:complete